MEQTAQLLRLIEENIETVLSLSLSKPVPRREAILQNQESSLLPNGCIRARIKPSASSPALSGGSPAFVLETFTDTKASRRTITAAQMTAVAEYAAGTLFKSAILRYENKTEKTHTITVVSLLANKKGKRTLLTGTEKLPAAREGTGTSKGIPEGVPVPFLIRLGIMTPAGKVIASKNDKFKQINRFLEYVEDIIPPLLSEKKDNTQPLRIIDFGCGKSYLTFAVYHYFRILKGIQIELLGLDLKRDVIENCRRLADISGYGSLQFMAGSIEDFRRNPPASFSRPDLVISLHACDTATDYALAFAAEHRAKAVLSVPCCQHELNGSIKKGSPAFASLLEYGLIKERFCALATDAIRAELLSAQGYKVQVLEFIDMSRTPKNMLIRAVYTGRRSGSAGTRAQALMQALDAAPTLRKLVKAETSHPCPEKQAEA